jgi:hypothetical protein
MFRNLTILVNHAFVFNINRAMNGDKFCRCFYLRDPFKDRYFICTLCPPGSKSRGSKRGYNNLKYHVTSSHLDHVKSVVDLFRASGTKNSLPNYAGLIGQRMAPKGTQLFGWLEYCIHEDLPLSCVGKPMIRKYCNIKPCCEKTLRRNFLKVGYLTALNVKRDLPSKFGLLFDGK